MPSYKAFLACFLGARRDHHAIFVERRGLGPDPDEPGGYLFHVIGTIAKGMSFDHRSYGNPDLSPNFLSKEYLGVISEDAFDQIEAVVSKIEPPKQQFDKMRRINPGEPLRDCQHWAADAVHALREAGILKSECSENGVHKDETLS